MNSFLGRKQSHIHTLDAYSELNRFPHNMANFLPQHEAHKYQITAADTTEEGSPSTSNRSERLQFENQGQLRSTGPKAVHNLTPPLRKHQSYPPSQQYVQLQPNNNQQTAIVQYPWRIHDQAEQVIGKDLGNKQPPILPTDYPIAPIKYYPNTTVPDHFSQIYRKESYPPFNHGIPGSVLDVNPSRTVLGLPPLHLRELSGNQNTTFKPTETKTNDNPRIHTISSNISISRFTNLDEKLGKINKSEGFSQMDPLNCSSDKMFFYLLSVLGLKARNKQLLASDLNVLECQAFNFHLNQIAGIFDIYFPQPILQIVAEVALHETSKMLLHSTLALGLVYNRQNGSNKERAKSCNDMSESKRTRLLKVPWENSQEVQSRILLASVMSGFYCILSGSNNVSKCTQDAVSILSHAKDIGSSFFYEMCFWGTLISELLDLLRHSSSQAATETIEEIYLKEYQDSRFYSNKTEPFSATKWLRKAIFNFRKVYGCYCHPHIGYSSSNLENLGASLSRYELSLPRSMHPVVYNHNHSENGIVIYFCEDVSALAMVFTQVAIITLEQMKQASLQDRELITRVLETIVGVFTVYEYNVVIGVVGQYVLEYISLLSVLTLVDDDSLVQRLYVLRQNVARRFGAFTDPF